MNKYKINECKQIKNKKNKNEHELLFEVMEIILQNNEFLFSTKSVYQGIQINNELVSFQ